MNILIFYHNFYQSKTLSLKIYEHNFIDQQKSYFIKPIS